MWATILDLFSKYSGNGFMVGLFLLSVIYLFFAEKEKEKRIVLLYVTVAILVLFFCPLFAKVIYLFLDDEIYYRILWLLPMSVISAYAGVKLVQNCKKVWMKIVSGVLVLTLIIGSGSYVYANPYFSPAQNRFHVPSAVVEVCDAIVVEGREVRAVMPSELLSYVRQYTAGVCMPYGREMMVERWENNSELFDAMEAEKADAGTIASLAYQELCHFIVLPANKEVVGSFEEHKYQKIKSVAGYDIYLCDDAYLGLEYVHEGF